MQTNSLRSPADVREWLGRHGVTISEWSRVHGFKPGVVFSLLSGRVRGSWGEAHEAAIALGLRAAPSGDEPHPLSTPSLRRSERPSAQSSRQESLMT